MAGGEDRPEPNLAVVASPEPDELRGVAASVGRRALARVMQRLGSLAPGFTKTARARLSPLPGFESLIPECHGIAVATVQEMLATIGPDAAGR